MQYYFSLKSSLLKVLIHLSASDCIFSSHIWNAGHFFVIFCCYCSQYKNNTLSVCQYLFMSTFIRKKQS